MKEENGEFNRKMEDMEVVKGYLEEIGRDKRELKEEVKGLKRKVKRYKYRCKVLNEVINEQKRYTQVENYTGIGLENQENFSTNNRGKE